MRYVPALKGEEITAIDMDIGFHHRSVEKIVRAPVVASIHPLYGPGRLSQRFGEQPGLLAVGGTARGNQGSGPGGIHPGHAHRIFPYQQSPGVVRHVSAGHRRDRSGFLCFSRSREDHGHRRADHRRKAASVLVSHRRSGAGPPRRLEGSGGRVRQDVSRAAFGTTRHWPGKTPSSKCGLAGWGPSRDGTPWSGE